MHYQIKQVQFSLKTNQLIHDTERIALTDKTAAALSLFLQSPQNIISKDDFMQAVWGNVIVSEASLFKQIQICRGLLQQIGLPEDSIENVYGKGYRLKYAVIELSEDDVNGFDAGQPQTLFRRTVITGAVLALLFIFIYGVTGWLNPNQPNQVLSEAKKQSIVELSKSDWQVGLQHINDLLAENGDYSMTDLGFLYQQQGQALLELQRYQESAQSLHQATDYFKQAQNSKRLGETHILLSRAFGALGQNKEQTDQVKQAVALFIDSDNTAQLVDALMELAFLHKKSGDFEAAIKTYQQAADRAKQGGDPVGQMMALNNLAATFLVMNDVDNAQQLLQQGLNLSLEIGEGRYIASAYSMMSQIYLQKNLPHKAIGQIQEALKYQLKSNSGRGLNPKLMTLNYLLVVTFQSQQADALLQLTQRYVNQLKQASPMATVQLYQGMNLAHQMKWSDAAERLQYAWQASQVNNFSYQRPMLLAYYALSHARSEQPIKAIEAAQKVMAMDEAESHEKTLAQLALAWAYQSLENNSQYKKIMSEVNESNIENWLFLAQQYWELKLKNTDQSDLSYETYQQQYKNVLINQQALSQSARVDTTVIQSLTDKIRSLIAELENQQPVEVSQIN